MSAETIDKTNFYEIIHPEIGQIRVYPTPEEASLAASEEIANLVNKNPEAAITYATGNTMVQLYKDLATVVESGKIDFSKTTAFHLDEYYPCGPDINEYPYGFVAYLRQLVFNPLKIGTVNEFNGLAEDPEVEAARYENLLNAQPINLALVGTGPWSDEKGTGCHIGFNESGTPFDSRTHVAELSSVTIARDRVERRQSSPDKSFTQGIGNILEAEKIIFLAFGEDKGVSLRQALYGEIGPQRPASALRLAGSKVTMYIDEAAARWL
jgi:glucosamine-6-phosphate deaminase